jgi:hypothetical protein
MDKISKNLDVSKQLEGVYAFLDFLRFWCCYAIKEILCVFEYFRDSFYARITLGTITTTNFQSLEKFYSF